MLDTTSEEYQRLKEAKWTAALLAALASPVRVRLVELLADRRERTPAELVAAIGGALVSTGQVGRHLGVLYQAGIVGWRRDGKRSCYRLIEPLAARLCQLVADRRQGRPGEK
jgi:DNA-binding transcriptional ArsR family regulator